ncbi:MAG: hypothetical protein Q7R48_01480 [bacterium]|nr:hypothetical protein [bacterium]
MVAEAGYYLMSVCFRKQEIAQKPKRGPLQSPLRKNDKTMGGYAESFRGTSDQKKRVGLGNADSSPHPIAHLYIFKLLCNAAPILILLKERRDPGLFLHHKREALPLALNGKGIFCFLYHGAFRIGRKKIHEHAVLNAFRRNRGLLLGCKRVSKQHSRGHPSRSHRKHCNEYKQ